MKFSDLVALAKAGYKPSEVKELLAIDTDPHPNDPKSNDPKSNDPKPNDPQPNDPQPNDPQPNDPQPNDPNPNDPKPNDPKPNDPKPNDPTDYKKLYEESKKTLEKLQAKNRKDPGKRKEPKSDEEIAIDFVNELFKGV